jgi:hypothetical protein
MKKLISLFLTLVIISLTTATAFADEKSVKTEAHFNSFTGIVKEIRKSDLEKGTSYLLLENKEGMEANLVLTKDTYYINDEKISIGSQVTGYYDANAMMIMIYPPQYVAVAVMVSNSKQNIKVDLFNKELVSADNSLKLNVSKDTEIVNKDGKKFKGDISNRKLAVFYGASTRSIPAQTNPDKIVVLSDPLVPDNDGNSYYASFKGKVTEITKPSKDNKHLNQVKLEREDGLEAIFTISKDTYNTNSEKIKLGSVVTGYYDAKVYRILIYPGQYDAEVLDIEKPNYNIKVDYFDEKLVSADKTLKIKIGKDTELIYMDGSKYHGKPVKSNLVVIYDVSTKSIPAQTEPIKVVVLENKHKKDKVKDVPDWKKKFDDWKKATDELYDNIDQMPEYKDEFYRYLWKLIIKNEKVFYEWLKGVIK